MFNYLFSKCFFPKQFIDEEYLKVIVHQKMEIWWKYAYPE